MRLPSAVPVIISTTRHGSNDSGHIYNKMYNSLVNAGRHAFQKKSKRGMATPKREIELIRQRLADAEYDYRRRQN